MEILGWLAFPALVALVAMAWAGWAGREQPQSGRADDAAYERLVAALTKDTPAVRKRVPPAPVQPSTGVAVRRGSRANAGASDDGAVR